MVNWISKFIKPKLKSLFKKKSAERDDALWQNCSCSKLTLKEDFEKNLFVCASCNKHFHITPIQRFDMMFGKASLSTRSQIYKFVKSIKLIKKCEDNWCKIKVKDYIGWVKKDNIWGRI